MFSKAFAVITNVIGQGTGKDLPYEASDENYSRLSGKTIWEVKRAKRKNNGEVVTVFVFDFTNKSEDEIKLARTAFMRLKTLRHPNILKFIDGVELPTSLHMITEEAIPLQVCLDNDGSGKSDYAISWGIHQTLKAISFLNNDCGLVHRNLCQSSVFVDAAGEWKLGGMEFVWQFSEDSLPPPKLLQDLNKYNPPEIANEMRGKKITKWSTDMWGLGCLIHEVFNGPLTQVSSLRKTSKIPNSLVTPFCQLVGANPKSRPNPSTLLSDLQKHGGYLSNQFVSVNLNIEEVQIMEPSQRSIFFKELDKHLDSFPDNFCKKKILPQLINAFEFGGAGSSVLSPLFKLGKLLDSEEYQRKIVPCVVKLFSSTDRATRVNLLQQLDQFIEHLQPSTVNEQIFPHVSIGFSDTLPAMREQTIKAMLLLAPKLNEKTLNTQLLRHLAKCQVDEKEGIRTNTTICLGKIAPHLSPSTRSKVLVSAFLRSLKDPFSPARIAGLRAMSATEEYYNTMDIATRLLPALCGVLVDRDKSVRDQAFVVLRSFVDKLEKISEDPELQKSEADASTASSWLGWASSITTSATSHNKNKSITSGGSTAASGDKEELKPTINTNNDKEKQTNSSSGVTVEKTSDQDEDDDECWEDGGWGEEDTMATTMDDDKVADDGWNDEEWASFEGDDHQQDDDIPSARSTTTRTGLKLKPTSDPFAELQLKNTTKGNNKKKQNEPSWEDFLSSAGASSSQPRYERKQPTPPPVNASLFDAPSSTTNTWTNSGWEDDSSFGDWGQDDVMVAQKTTNKKKDTRPIGDSSGWEVDTWGDFETEHPPQKDTKSSDRDAERKKRQEERRIKQQQARQKRSAGLGSTKPSGLGDVKKD